ncbi:hypothetical protein ACFQ4K_33770 [Tistrella bauzanensis]
MADRPDRRRRLIAIGVSAPILLTGAILLTGGCTGIQSTLDPAGIGAERVASLFWVMLTGAGIIWVMVMAIAIHAARRRRRSACSRPSGSSSPWAPSSRPWC